MQNNASIIAPSPKNLMQEPYARVQEPKAWTALRKQGLCPHDQTPCFRTKQCVMKKGEACAVLVASLKHSCDHCNIQYRCKWHCFRKPANKA